MPSAMRAKRLAELVQADLQAGFDAAELTPDLADGQFVACEYSPFRAESQLATLNVITFPFARRRRLQTRALTNSTYQVGVFVCMAAGLNQTGEALAEYLAPLCEQIADRLHGKTLDDATCLEIEHDPLFDHERLRSDRVFEAIIALSFRDDQSRA